jgi:hypothetical protein
VRISDFSHYALTNCVAAAMLAGCSGSPQGQIGAAVPNAMVARGQAHRAGSRSDLLYLVTDENLFYAIDYATGKAQIITFAGGGNGGGACTDASGNLFISAWVDNSSTLGEIFEYAHGGKSPISTLSDGSYYPAACSVDPTTGNLAMANSYNLNCNGGGNVAIYPDAAGQPTTYSDSSFQCYIAAAYDNEGNLFIGGVDSGSNFILAELPSGSSNLTTISLDEQISCRFVNGACKNSLQWDGTYLAITQRTTDHKSPVIYRVSVSGSTGKVVGKTTFVGRWTTKTSGAVSWIDGDSVIMGYHPGSLAVWKYPSGGKLVRTVVKGLTHYQYMGLAMSQ